MQAGQQAAQQVYQQMPILRDNTIDRYVDDVGQRLVAAIPSEFQHPEFRYSFDVVDARDINAGAARGGRYHQPREMFEAAHRGQMAAPRRTKSLHVALRHATAQAIETVKLCDRPAGQIAARVIGGVPGAAIGTAAQIGFGAGALKYSQAHETQPDIRAQIDGARQRPARPRHHVPDHRAREQRVRGPEAVEPVRTPATATSASIKRRRSCA